MKINITFSVPNPDSRVVQCQLNSSTNLYTIRDTHANSKIYWYGASDRKATVSRPLGDTARPSVYRCHNPFLRDVANGTRGSDVFLFCIDMLSEVDNLYTKRLSTFYFTIRFVLINNVAH